MYEHMRLTASIKRACAYEKMCAYKKGARNNLSLRYGAHFVLERVC